MTSLLSLFDISPQMMPIIRPSIGVFGHTDASILGAEIPITAIFGDQQAALYGHGCDRPGLLKCTYGTGAFLVSNTGNEVVRSQNQLLSTIAWSQANGDAKHPKIGYAIEGSMFTAGACIQWLRDGIQVITNAAETQPLAEMYRTTAVFTLSLLSAV
jgi:glycerol kinase